MCYWTSYLFLIFFGWSLCNFLFRHFFLRYVSFPFPYIINFFVVWSVAFLIFSKIYVKLSFQLLCYTSVSISVYCGVMCSLLGVPNSEMSWLVHFGPRKEKKGFLILFKLYGPSNYSFISRRVCKIYHVSLCWILVHFCMWSIIGLISFGHIGNDNFTPQIHSVYFYPPILSFSQVILF